MDNLQNDYTNIISFTSEKELAEIYQTKIQPFWLQQVVQGTFEGVEEVSIAYAYVLHPKSVGELVISSGRIETLLKYKELIYDLYQQGYSVFIHDHRGQGLSGRMTENLHMGYVKSFDDYVTDFKLFMQQIVQPNCQHKANLLCHSMGGTIGFLTILKYPDLFNKVIFSAPMFGILPALPNWLAKFLLNTHSKITKGLNKQYDYFWGQSDYENTAFAQNNLTHNQVRYQLFRDEYERAVETKLGGVTGHWLQAAVEAMDKIKLQACEFPIPALVLQAGGDTVVDNKRQSQVVALMPNTELFVVEGAKHELLEESDEYRTPVLQKILSFISSENNS
ncbi:alpha/beta fold hydrolase [Paraglaciecola aquimarina]|uniref:Alpha/beta fold hydrolase n=1 Tax=Paraglaciecola algarum TaxID=3050085 RepID=A0ABS9DA95_9ALTE|nr:alpha/beta fold hydrolase [Paraglaciecola sp. G1-23]MCF2949322.1 alpha/beta fold hydrolase [Paraglaciecola sp. G1-23]